MPQSPHSGPDSVQTSWPDLTCYGCGPANEVGLHLESYLGEDSETLVATVQPDEIFNSGAPNVMYGGHIASLIDCHSIWTAITFAYIAENRQLGSSPRIAYVTGELCVDYHAPTPLDCPIELTAWVDGDPGTRRERRDRRVRRGRPPAPARAPQDGRGEHGPVETDHPARHLGIRG